MSGRPNTVESFIVDYVCARPEPTLNVARDRDALLAAAAERGLENFSLPDALKRLMRKGQAHRLQRGSYVIEQASSEQSDLWGIEPVATTVLAHLEIEHFVSWHAALWYYDLIDQQSVTVRVATSRRKRPVTVGVGAVQFVALPTDRLFGFTVVDDLDWPVQMATPARAIVDAFMHPEFVGPPAVIVDALRRALQRELVTSDDVVQMALKMDSPSLNRRVGYCLEFLGRGRSEDLQLRLGRTGAVPLFPRQGVEPSGEIETDPVWRISIDRNLAVSIAEFAVHS